MFLQPWMTVAKNIKTKDDTQTLADKEGTTNDYYEIMVSCYTMLNHFMEDEEEEYV